MWSLKVVRGQDLAEKLVPEVRLPEPLTRFVIGRDPAASWHIADRTLALSARHCEIVATPAGPALRDLSTNGTFVNAARDRLQGTHLLRDGDQLELGPFIVAVSGPPVGTRPMLSDGAVAAAAPAPRSAGVMETAPLRGGDPAAMLGALAGRGAPVGLTEILRAAPAADDAGLDLTRIRPAGQAAPRPAPAPATATATATAEPAVPAPSAAPTAPGGASPQGAPLSAAAPAMTPSVAATAAPAAATLSRVDAEALRQALARGLGVAAADLPPTDVLRLAEQVAALAQGGVAAVHQLLAATAPSRTGQGGPGGAADAEDWTRAPTAAAALRRLLGAHGDDPARPLAQAAGGLRARHERLDQAARAAAQLAEAARQRLSSALDDPPAPAARP